MKIRDASGGGGQDLAQPQPMSGLNQAGQVAEASGSGGQVAETCTKSTSMHQGNTEASAK